MLSAGVHSDELTRVEQILVNSYGIKAVVVERVKSVFRICAEGRWYYFKPIASRYEPRVKELHGLTVELCRRGLRAAPPIADKDGRFVVQVSAEQWGYLQPSLPGKHADFANRQHRVTTIAAIGYLHRLASGWPMSSLARPVGLRLMDKFSTKRRTFERLLPVAGTHCAELRTLPRPIVDGLSLWSQPTRAMRLTAGLLRFCHRDLAPHNLIVDEQVEGVGLIDFDLAGFDHPFIDLVQISNHSLSLSPGVYSLYADLVSVYRAVAGLDEVQEQWLWRLFAFPEILIRSVIEWANSGYPDEERKAVLNALAREQWRYQRLAEECPFGLY